MATIFNSILNRFRNGSILTQLILINIGIFLILRIGALVCHLSGIPDQWWVHWVELPSDPQALLRMPWTVVTYMFSQFDFLHILFNMLCLYWFGQVFLFTGTSRQMLALYIYGGIAGALAFIGIYNLLPAFSGTSALLLGASASVMAIVIATAIRHPNYKVGLLFFGEISLKWIAVAVIVIDLISVGGSNAGGHIAHIGGAVAGIIYGVMLNRGRDITKPFCRLMDTMVNLFNHASSPLRKDKSRSKARQQWHFYREPSSSRGATAQGSSGRNATGCPEQSDNDTLDEILDKIKKSGYTSLTAEERRRLFDVSKKIK